MKIQIKLAGTKNPLVYEGERIDILDFEMNDIKYKQVRVFRKGFSKSELLVSDLIVNIQEIKK